MKSSNQPYLNAKSTDQVIGNLELNVSLQGGAVRSGACSRGRRWARNQPEFPRLKQRNSSKRTWPKGALPTGRPGWPDGVHGHEPDGVYQPLHQLCRRGRPSTVVDQPRGLQLRVDGRRARRKLWGEVLSTAHHWPAKHRQLMCARNEYWNQCYEYNIQERSNRQQYSDVLYKHGWFWKGLEYLRNEAVNFSLNISMIELFSYTSSLQTRSRGQNRAPIHKFCDKIVKLNFQEWDVLKLQWKLNYIDNYMVKTCEAWSEFYHKI
jgi:hypothetical protein